MSIHTSSTPSSATSSSAGSPPALQAPTTPVSPTPDQLQTSMEENNNMNGNDAQSVGPPKRKPSRRANTAERRATHNAVERQRRETLNGRFLDLAALLPNLATVRRPSKSAIVNSSIALIHQSRRQRLLAARHLRLLKVEADALRRELNEWRDRSGLPRVEEQNRAPEFLELLGLAEGEGGENWWDGEALEEMGEEERKAYELVGLSTGQDEDGDEVLMEGGEEEEQHLAMPARNVPVPRMANIPAHVKNNGAMGVQNPVHVMSRGNVNVQQQQVPHMHQRGMSMHGNGLPTIASPTGLQFEHGQMMSHPGLHNGVHTMYDPTGHPHPHSHSLPVNPNFSAASMGLDEHNVDVKVAAWNAQLFNGQWAHAQQQQQQTMFTPPGTAGSNNGSNATSPIPIPNPFGGNHHQQQVYMNMQQQQMNGMPHMSLGPGHVYGSPEADDASSVSSMEGGPGGNVRSVGSSPQPHQVYDVNGMVGYSVGGGAGMRRPSLSLNTSVNAAGQGQMWSGATPHTGQQQPQMVSVSAGGGGGSGRVFAPMMSMMM